VTLPADPRLTDYELLLENIAALRDGKPAEVPIYDFKQSKRVGFQRVEVPASRVVIIEGIYALSSRIRHVHPEGHAQDGMQHVRSASAAGHRASSVDGARHISESRF